MRVHHLLLSLSLVACQGRVVVTPPPTQGGQTAGDAGALMGDAGDVPTEPPPIVDPGPTEPAPTEPTEPEPTEPEPTEPEPTEPAPTEPTEPGPTACVNARQLWSDGFESGDYAMWTGRDYGGGWGTDCQQTSVTTERARSGRFANRSTITCPSHTDVHRGYGGVQFAGDTPLPGYTNTGSGIEAPHGVVNTFWIWLDASYDFGSGRWLSLWTTNGSCDWSERVITLGLENAGRRLTPAHIETTGGRVMFEAGAPSVPLRQWVRVSVYINYHSGDMHVWQDGQSVLHATFTRPSTDICQWHWGAYASGDNTDVTLFEDDKSIWRLEEAWTDFTREPWLDEGVTVCR
ncbi:MAG TPA: hypothetical protein DEF51_50850 [Myxococcales bacterium]|nr:hypothetical protein [Myxococcales bacterium]